MSSVHRSQQLFLAEEKLPQLLTGVLQAIAWVSPQGRASGTVQRLLAWLRDPVAVPAGGCVSACLEAPMRPSAAARPGTLPAPRGEVGRALCF